jgi:hypothetical protein
MLWIPVFTGMGCSAKYGLSGINHSHQVGIQSLDA